MKRLFAVLLLSVVVAGGCYDKHKEPSVLGADSIGNCEIARLRGLCQTECRTITMDINCKGYVTSSDAEGNFYRTMVVEDGSGAVEIKLGTYNIASQYPIGTEVALSLKGTAIMVERGVVQLGLPPQSFDASPREMEVAEVIDKHIIRSGNSVNTTPLECEIKQINGSLCGRLICVERLHYMPPAEEEEAALLEGYHRFVDKEGNIIYLYTSEYADFAKLEIPRGATTLQGVLYYETVGRGKIEHFVIKPRFANDISPSHNPI